MPSFLPYQPISVISWTDKITTLNGDGLITLLCVFVEHLNKNSTPTVQANPFFISMYVFLISTSGTMKSASSSTFPGTTVKRLDACECRKDNTNNTKTTNIAQHMCSGSNAKVMLTETKIAHNAADGRQKQYSCQCSNCLLHPEDM